MYNRKTDYQKRVKHVAVFIKQLGPMPSPRLAFNFINYQDYRRQFLLPDVRHFTQVCVLEHIIMLSHTFIKGQGVTNFYHSNKQLSGSIGLTIPSIRKVLLKLEEHGVVQKSRATSTSKTHYKLNYIKLMQHYKSYLNPDLLESNSSTKVYNERLKYFAYMAKLGRLIEAYYELPKPTEKSYTRIDIDDYYDFDDEDDD